MKNTALIIVDLQNDYFPDFDGASWPLENTKEVASNTLALLEKFREEKMPIVYIKHESLSEEAPFFVKNTKGLEIYNKLKPLKNEEVIIKHDINAFKNTNLKDTLDRLNIEKLFICGAMSHMCVDAITRASKDYDYECFVAFDACATLPLEFNGRKVSSLDVHTSFMAALNFAYAKVHSSKNLIQLL